MRPVLILFRNAPATILAIALLCSLLPGGEFHLQLKTRTVYILPMANGLDRHLASRLTSSGAVWVVLDPENHPVYGPSSRILHLGSRVPLANCSKTADA